MNLPLLLIVVGILVGILLNYAIGVACVLIGVVLLIFGSFPRPRY